MAANNGLSAYKMAGRILEREDNLYKKDVIYDVLKMYMDECYKALLRGERVQLSKVGTIIPEVKTHIGNFNLSVCNKEGGNPPYTKVRIYRNGSLTEAMNKTLIDNIENGIYGLEKLPFEKQQLNILKESGFICKDTMEGKEEKDNE